MRKTYSDKEAYKIFVEEFGKTVERAKKINPNAKVEMITPYSSFVGALQDKINDAKARGTRPSSKAKLAKTLAHYYAYPTTAEDVSKLKDQVTDLMSGGFGKFVQNIYRAAGYDVNTTSFNLAVKGQHSLQDVASDTLRGNMSDADVNKYISNYVDNARRAESQGLRVGDIASDEFGFDVTGFRSDNLEFQDLIVDEKGQFVSYGQYYPSTEQAVFTERIYINSDMFGKLVKAYTSLNKRGAVNNLRAYEYKDLVEAFGLDQTIAIVKDVLSEQGITGKDANKWIATHIFKSPD